MNIIDPKNCDGRIWPTADEMMQLQYPRPIPVSERLPEMHTDVLVLLRGEWDCGDFYRVGEDIYYHANSQLDGEPFDPAEITHWLPLPPLPLSATPAAEHTATEQPADSSRGDSDKSSNAET